MSKDYGGPAFPESYDGADMPHEGIGNGMTLRDYFAAKAMQAYIHYAGFSGLPADDAIARYSYAIADTMLTERDK